MTKPASPLGAEAGTGQTAARTSRSQDRPRPERQRPLGAAMPRPSLPARPANHARRSPGSKGWLSRTPGPASRHEKAPGRIRPGVWSFRKPAQISKRSGRICSNRPVSASAFSTACGSGASR